ncbi:pilus assembly protein CpaD [Rhodoblastus acidophilus]|uniref:CpaD family pilus assembly protein n=1 Tax=Rhodoblastus acidophilus TaxID=1074 RepID=UPI002224D886|nr:CpaD family pilus assembly protein [Rhodoblastus acidophilus]MCW2284685.1 pilus assembly protein CpaD [Rhodoblastus acidophilus]MCW2333638.1 pilus assembly protein CpaD [Rhodoblastus acidophilus]
MPHLRLIKTSEPAGLKRWARAAALLVAVPLAACSSGGADRIVATTIPSQDFHARHPIELANSRATLDVIPYVHAGALDARSKSQIKQFASDYAQSGEGEIALALPQGGPGAAEARAAVPAVRAALAAGGARSYVAISSYPIADPSVAAPIRLSYATVIARTRTRCGQWPNDLASGSSAEGWNNTPYWNLGCANQQMIAAQTADPRDLLGPAATTPPDSQMRSRGIVAVRQGKDPGTDWKVQNSSISAVGN